MRMTTQWPVEGQWSAASYMINEEIIVDFRDIFKVNSDQQLTVLSTVQVSKWGYEQTTALTWRIPPFQFIDALWTNAQTPWRNLITSITGNRVPGHIYDFSCFEVIVTPNYKYLQSVLICILWHYWKSRVWIATSLVRNQSGTFNSAVCYTKTTPAISFCICFTKPFHQQQV